MENKEDKNIFFQSLLKLIKLPALILLVGFILQSLTLLKLPRVYQSWQPWMAIMADVGNILISLSMVAFVYFAILSICNGYKQYFLRKDSATVIHMMSIIRNGLRIIFILITINIILSQLDIQPKYTSIIHNGIYLIIIAAVAWVLIQTLVLIENMLQPHYLDTSANAEIRRAVALYTRIHIIRNVMVVIIVIVAIASSLMIFDKVRNIGISLLASAGFATAVVALAAQKTLSSLIVGLQLVITHPLEIGDLVVVENESGVVEEINLSYIIVKIWDSRRLIFPINYFIEKPFQNWSRGMDGLLGVVKLYVDYTFPITALRTELQQVVKNIPAWDRRTCTLAVSDCDQHVMELRIIASTANPADIDNLRCELREKMLHFISKNYPQFLPHYRLITSTNE